MCRKPQSPAWQPRCPSCALSLYMHAHSCNLSVIVFLSCPPACLLSWLCTCLYVPEATKPSMAAKMPQLRTVMYCTAYVYTSASGGLSAAAQHSSTGQCSRSKWIKMFKSTGNKFSGVHFCLRGVRRCSSAQHSTGSAAMRSRSERSE
jgi:hypothetical protein